MTWHHQHMSPCKRSHSPAPPSSPTYSKQTVSAALHPGWQILLQQHIITKDTRLLCTLLSCSKSVVRAMVPGTLDIRYILSPKRHPQQGRDFGSWLARFGGLVRQLEPNSNEWIRKYGMSSAEAAIAAGLHAAAATAPLQLQAYKSITDGASKGEVLLALPANHLTRLDLQLYKPEKSDISQYTAALAGLTSLQSLILAENISTSSSIDADSTAATADSSFLGSLLPALASLTQLTNLSIPAPRTAAGFSCLPPKLAQLTFTAQYNFIQQQAGQPAMQLGHLTAITSLVCFHSLQQGDVLPPQLNIIMMPDVSCLEPLLGLQQLQAIVLPAPDWGYLPTDRPEGLDNHKQLQHVTVKYYRPATFCTLDSDFVEQTKLSLNK